MNEAPAMSPIKRGSTATVERSDAGDSSPASAQLHREALSGLTVEAAAAVHRVTASRASGTAATAAAVQLSSLFRRVLKVCGAAWRGVAFVRFRKPPHRRCVVSARRRRHCTMPPLPSVLLVITASFDVTVRQNVSTSNAAAVQPLFSLWVGVCCLLDGSSAPPGPEQPDESPHDAAALAVAEAAVDEDDYSALLESSMHVPASAGGIVSTLVLPRLRKRLRMLDVRVSCCLIRVSCCCTVHTMSSAVVRCLGCVVLRGESRRRCASSVR
jgi:hypothetical protein